MREILFRGKRTDNGKWIYGDLRYISDWKGGYNPHIVDNTNGRNNSVTGLEIIPETVGQYTGLTDKNGMKIFEGDILTIENEGVYAAIKYNESNAAFYVEDEDHEDYLGEAWETDVVIIGNIHDDPDMVEGGANNA
ncbi:MAG: YopX family protein [Huintestinicola sp.]